MKNLRRSFERFCFRNQNKGIKNLMLYICSGSAVVYLLSMISQNFYLYNLLCFDRTRILSGEIWRLFTYPLTFESSNLLLTAIALLCYYSIGQAMENIWGTLRFNLFYLTGVILMDIYCLIFGGRASVSYLNLSLFLSYATLFPDSSFLLFFIIPVRAWILALFNLAIVLLGLFTSSFPYNLFPVVSLANYFLFFGKDVLNVIPVTWQANARRLFRKKPKGQKGRIIHFEAGSYEASHATPKAPYTHRCTVCGRTDVSNPELEFRYCSRCKGYYCYCQDHINNHVHIE